MARQINLVGLNRPRGGRYGDCKRDHGACAMFLALYSRWAVVIPHFLPVRQLLDGAFRNAQCVIFAATANLLARCGRTVFLGHRKCC